MPSDRERLVTSLAQLNMKAVLESTDKLLSLGVPGEEIFALLQRGMDLVNNSCTAGEYFIADLIMANNIYREALDHLTRSNPAGAIGGMGKVLMGTVQGDIHDLGKNLIALLLRNGGFEVTDLGVSVPPERFSSAVLTEAPDLLIISGTLSGSEIMIADARHEELMNETVQYLLDARDMLAGGEALDFAESDLRSAWMALGEITGESVNDDIVDEIFSRF